MVVFPIYKYITAFSNQSQVFCPFLKNFAGRRLPIDNPGGICYNDNGNIFPFFGGVMEITFFILELVGTVAFAASGAMTAMKRGMDLFGIVVLGITTATGGGMIRDILIGKTPPAVFREPVWFLCAALVSLLLFFPLIGRNLARRRALFERVLFFMDALGLGIFTVSGIRAGMNESPEAGVPLLLFVGVVTGVGGGIVRDLFAGDIPYIFSKHIYACASLLGAGAFLLAQLILPAPFCDLCGIAVTLLVRILAARYRWNLPHCADYFKDP